MTQRDYVLKQVFAADPQTVFDAIVDVRAWWSGRIDGNADAIGAEFRYRYARLHDSTQRVVELVAGQKVVWRVLDAQLSFVEETSEWKGTDIVFELSPLGKKTQLVFTHIGLNPSLACYDACSGGWAALLSENLVKRVATGKAQPDVFADVSSR